MTVRNVSRGGLDYSVNEESSPTQNFEQIRNDLLMFAYGTNPDLNNIPSIRSIIRFMGSCRGHRPATNPLYDGAKTDLKFFSSADPVDYYVFGLRKIIT